MWHSDSCECGDICAHHIPKSLTGLWRKPQDGNRRTASPGLGPVGGFPYGHGQLDSVFCSFLSLSLSYLFMVQPIYSVSFPTPGIISGMVP